MLVANHRSLEQISNQLDAAVIAAVIAVAVGLAYSLSARSVGGRV
jgi:hypothetical protein